MVYRAWQDGTEVLVWVPKSPAISTIYVQNFVEAVTGFVNPQYERIEYPPMRQTREAKENTDEAFF